MRIIMNTNIPFRQFGLMGLRIFTSLDLFVHSIANQESSVAGHLRAFPLTSLS